MCRRQSIKFLHLSKKVLLTPPDEGPRVKGQRIKLQDIVDGLFLPQHANGSWIDGKCVVRFNGFIIPSSKSFLISVLLFIPSPFPFHDFFVVCCMYFVFCRRGVSVSGPFGSHLSAECSQSLGTCPHVQRDICKYIVALHRMSLEILFAPVFVAGHYCRRLFAYCLSL